MKRTRKLLTAMMTAAVVATGATGAMADGAKIFVIGGKADDPFWSKVKKGADDAGKVAELTGGSVTWLGPQNYDNLGPDAAKLIRTALSQKPSAIVGPDWVPEAMDDAFKEVVAAGVPLIIYNSGGMDAAKRLGAERIILMGRHTDRTGLGRQWGATDVVAERGADGIAKVLEERLGAWKIAVEAEDIVSVMGLYADEYEDARGERLQVVKRAYEWFFTRCNAMRAAFQVRRWDFSSFETSGQVSVVAYCSLRGNAVSDPTGRNADQTLELPRTDTNEITLTFTGSGGVWRIQKTEPPLPDFDTLQAYTAGMP